ncbi:AAA family ATPase [Tabrizicola sp.]|uniref:AAA family ATPase n=1 Tax=Tabrizicola sp. TaxID=2005166 RepID=UPI003F347B49
MHDFITSFAADALQSEIFAGGLALGLLGTALGLSRLLYQRLRWLAGRRFVVSMTLDNRAAAYRHLYAWIEATGVLSHVRQLRLTDLKGTSGEMFGPAPGSYWFWYQGRPCRFSRDLDEKTRVGGPYDAKPMETITLTLPFGRAEVIRGWLAEGAAHLRSRERRGPELHVARGDWWEAMGALPGRGLSTVLSDDDRLHHLAADMRRFLGASQWYADRAIPWRRGYLLYGPPGTGKSSVLRALATELKLDLALIDLCRPGLSDDDLRELMFCAPDRAIIAMEDVDAVFRGREADQKGGISFSGLLNAIDGVAAQEGRALVMTTNHREKLDPALIRPGRADVQMELGTIGAATAAKLYLRFFPGEEAGATRFADRIGTRRLTGAEVQGWLLAHAEDPVAAAAWQDAKRDAPPLPQRGEGMGVGGQPGDMVEPPTISLPRLEEGSFQSITSSNDLLQTPMSVPANPAGGASDLADDVAARRLALA